MPLEPFFPPVELLLPRPLRFPMLMPLLLLPAGGGGPGVVTADVVTANVCVNTAHTAVGDIVGGCVGESLGEVVGAEVVGEPVGEVVGDVGTLGSVQTVAPWLSVTASMIR